MATYAIGDVQGCYGALRRLLDQLKFDPAQDRLWFAGDLVNRGPASLATLRFVYGIRNAVTMVLGNHDLHLLAVADGGKLGRRDTLAEILAASDREELLDWLRLQPLFYESSQHNCAMLHAGLPPQWRLEQARAYAREAEHALRGPKYSELLRRMYGDQPDIWDPDLRSWQRLRFIINCFTRLRYCTPEGRIDAGPKGAPGTQARGLVPWFQAPDRRLIDTEILFGHWSTLGRTHWPEEKVWCLDTGCIWGGALTALCLETRSLHAVHCDEYRDADGHAD
jgi:bis(5'-nucleosyl)-tetraphosphatase (symmetrical)